MKNQFLLLPCCSALLGLVAEAAAQASDWPQWRGPNRDAASAETGLLKDWPAGGPPLVWKATGVGLGYAAVSVAQGRVFTVGDKAAKSFVVCLNAADGKELWSARLGQAGASGWGGFVGPRAAPTVDGELVFALGQWGDFVCLEAAAGKESWRKDFTNDFRASRPEWGWSESPLVDGDKVVFTPGGKGGVAVALNKSTGAPGSR